MPQRPSTQSTLSVIDIKDDIVVMTNRRYRAVFKVKAINFDLLSEDEQDSIIYAYASLINSLDYSIQILVKTRQLNITAYLEYLEQHKQSQTSRILKQQIDSYQNFINKLVIENNVLFKTFYVIVPFDAVVVNKSSIFDPITALLPGREAGAALNYSRAEFDTAKQRLEQMTSDLQSSFQRIGLQTTRMDSSSLVSLFYTLYNPEEDSAEQRVNQDIDDYTSAMVRPAVQ